MCVLCRLLHGCRARNCQYYETETHCHRAEPRMHTHCASGIGTSGNVPCGCGECMRNCDCRCERSCCQERNCD